MSPDQSPFPVTGRPDRRADIRGAASRRAMRRHRRAVNPAHISNFQKYKKSHSAQSPTNMYLSILHKETENDKIW